MDEVIDVDIEIVDLVVLINPDIGMLFNFGQILDQLARIVIDRQQIGAAKFPELAQYRAPGQAAIGAAAVQHGGDRPLLVDQVDLFNTRLGEPALRPRQSHGAVRGHHNRFKVQQQNFAGQQNPLTRRPVPIQYRKCADAQR